MSGNSLGRMFRLTTFGESHGPAIGCVIDGCPPRLPLDREAVARQLARRRPGQSDLTTSRDEADAPEFLSGLDAESGLTLGTPLAILVRNRDHRSESYRDLRRVYRPSHADYTYEAKYAIRAWQGGGRASARETIGRVAAGAVAEQVLAAACPELRILAWVERVGDIESTGYPDPTGLDRAQIDAQEARCPDPATAARMAAAIRTAKEAGDSLGGVIRLMVTGLPPGLGDPVFAKLDAELARAMCSIPAVKGFSAGSGFAAAGMRGSQHNDPFHWEGGRLVTTSNHSGGIQGGISNGMPIDCHIAFKPTATLSRPQATADADGNDVELTASGRHDPCVLPRAIPVVEAMAALVLCDALLCQRSILPGPVAMDE